MGSDKLRVTFNIAEEELKTVINREDEESLRLVEREVAELWRKWRSQNPTRTKGQILAMIAFQYAKLYYDESAENRRRESELTDFVKTYEDRLNDIVLDV